MKKNNNCIWLLFLLPFILSNCSDDEERIYGAEMLSAVEGRYFKETSCEFYDKEGNEVPVIDCDCQDIHREEGIPSDLWFNEGELCTTKSPTGLYSLWKKFKDKGENAIWFLMRNPYTFDPATSKLRITNSSAAWDIYDGTIQLTLLPDGTLQGDLYVAKEYVDKGSIPHAHRRMLYTEGLAPNKQVKPYEVFDSANDAHKRMDEQMDGWTPLDESTHPWVSFTNDTCRFEEGKMTYSNATLEKRYAYKTTTDSLYLTELLADGSAGKQEAYRMDYLWINLFAIYQFGGHESLLFSLKE